MRSVILILIIAAISIHAAPQRDDDDELGVEQALFRGALSLFRGFLGVPEPRNEGFNPLQLISFANSFLGGGEGGNRLNSFSDEIDETVQDPRVLKYEQEINRRNQLGRIARVFSSILLR